MRDIDLTGDPSRCLDREWLETDGRGGYGSSTLCGANTRRQHGLLVIPGRGDEGRRVVLSGVEETVRLGERSYPLHTRIDREDGPTGGWRSLVSFRSDPFPTRVHRLGGVELERSDFHVWGTGVAVVRYRWSETELPLRLTATPLFAFRSSPTLRRRMRSDFPRPVRDGDWIGVPDPDEEIFVWFSLLGADFHPRAEWHTDRPYPADEAFGLDALEDLMSFGTFEIDARDRRELFFLAAVDRYPLRSPWTIEADELARRARLVPERFRNDRMLSTLFRAGEHHVIRRGDTPTVVAGYPWYEDWGRDTMVSFPGLFLVTGRYRDARTLLEIYARQVRQGMLANRLTVADGEPVFGSADASLWYVLAVRRYLDYTQDYPYVKRALWPFLKGLVYALVKGSRSEVRMGGDGLLAIDPAAAPMTWMDSRSGGKAVTPRGGKAVEINALWYNAMRVTASLAGIFGERALAVRLKRHAARIRRSFASTFWNPEAGCLHDVVGEEGPDPTVRPNQILALALPYRLLSPEREAGLLGVVERELATPRGLRTISPHDPRYQGACAGDPAERALAWHQGAVYPWLVGPYVTALVRCRGEEGRAAARELLLGFEDHLEEAGVGLVSELFEGDPPHRPEGAISQAWSVAEWIRAYCEDVLGHAGPERRMEPEIARSEG
jgi:predicted glycogen debranching enzyme